MFKTLRLSFSLKNTYRVNTILYAIRQIPLIKRIIPCTVYQIRGFKIFANVLSVIWEILSAFVGKILYFAMMVAAPIGLFGLSAESDSEAFFHLLLFLSLIGAEANTFLFDPDKDKYYAMILLGMNAREYTLVNYFYAIFKTVIGFTLCSFLFGSPMGIAGWQCLFIPFFVAGVKMTYAAIGLISYRRNGKAINENAGDKFRLIRMLLFLGAAYALPAAGVVIPKAISLSVMIVFIVIGCLSVKEILPFPHYRAMYKELLADTSHFADKPEKALLADESRKKIGNEKGITSSKNGFEYLNELFIKRHRRLLWKPVKIIAASAAVLIAGAFALFYFVPQSKEIVGELLMSCLPYMVFVMYAINRGTGFTQALFINCDHSLLTYSFYKKPRFILKLFWIRLREITKINLLPASVIGAGLALLLFASGGTDNPLNYPVLFVSVMALGIFFSVHYLTLYYLLQPYNAGTEIKSGTYQLMTGGTYFVCYMMMQFQLPTFVFGLLTILFCAVYCLVASALVYFLAPKTFRIRP